MADSCNSTVEYFRLHIYIAIWNDLQPSSTRNFLLTDLQRITILKSNTSFSMKNVLTDNVIGIRNNTETLKLDPACQDHVPSATSKISTNTKQRRPVICKMNIFGERMECLQGIREHVRLSSKLTETVKGKLSLGAKILQVGGLEKIFKKLFRVKDGEKLLKVSQCYLSTTSGPMAGLLFISTDTVAFCSERSIKVTSPTGKLLRISYKVMIPMSKINKAKESENSQKPSQKYIQIVTEDEYEFWFMGFLNLQKTLKYLHHTLSGSQAC